MNMDDEADRSPNQNLNCDQGPMSSSGLTEFDSHHGSHREDRPYKCNQCDKSYRHAGSLVNHKKTHQVGLYTCLICQKEYSNPMGLKSHLRTHSEEKRFKCEQCGEAFRMSQQLYNHRKSLHAYYSTPNAEKITRNAKFETQSPVLVESSNLMTNLENYIAESMLPVDFPQLVSKYPDEKAGDEAPVKEESVEYEAFTDEKDQPNDSSMEEYRYKCTQCEKAYKHAGSLANHKQSHVIGVYQCAVCFKEFSNLMAMKNHCRLHSDSRARRSCKSPLTSGKNAGGHLDLTDCLQPVEKANRPPSLPDLSKQIKSEDQDSVPVLETHWHYGPESLSPVTKPNHDDVTDIPFGSDSAIDANEDDAKEKTNDFAEYEDANDEDSKSGVRPFTCQECGKSYRHAGSLINHKKTHQTGVYSCSLCSKKMFNMAALKNHLRAHFKSKAGKRLEDAHFPSASLSDDVCQNQEDSFEYGNSDISTNERDFLKHHFLHQKQEINEILIDNLVEEEVPESGIWHETPQVSQASSDDSAYSSGPALPEAKMEMDSLAFQPSSQEVSLATEFEVKLERKDDDDLQNADTSVAIPQPDPVSLKEEESSGLEEHLQSPDDRPHKCELCGRTYRHKSSLINHKLTHKTGVYQCSICPKQYSNLMALRNHVRFHSRSYAGRKSISSRQGHQFFRTRPRFLQSKSHSLANSVKLNERIPQRATTSQRAGKQLLHEAQVLCTFGMLFNHSENFQSSRRSCLSAISVTPAKTPTNAQSTSPEKDLFKVKEEEPHKKITGTSENPGRRVYKCNLCSKSYRHSGSLINHKRTHQTGDYACPYCSKHVHNMAALKNHIRIHHKIKKSEPKEMSDQALLYSDLSYPSDAKGVYGCVSCREMFHTENDLLAHQMVHAPLEGDRWDDQVHKSSSTEVKKDVNFTGMGDSEWDHSSNLGIKGEHLDSAAEDQEPEYTCVECGEVYDHIDDLNYHKRSHQAGIFQCSFCPKEYPSLSALRSHFETHTKPQTLRTTVLGGSDGNDFVDHQVPADKQYDCGHCGLIFSNEVDFHQHQVAHEKQQRMAESLPEIQEVQEPEFSFSMHSSERELLNRIKSEIEETERSGNLDGGSQLSHICGFCGETYDDLESLKAHSFIHRNGEDFSANENIPPKPDENHQQPCSESSPKNGEIPERRPYTCEQCGKTYRHGGSLVNHKKTHLVGNFQCVACSRHYPNLAAYRTHLRHHPNCKRSSAVNNLHDLQTSTLQDHRYPSGNDKSLPFSPYLPADSLSPHGLDKCANYATSVSPSSKTTLHKKNSMRLFSHPVGSISADQITQQTSTSLAHSVEDSKVQACKLCGKMFPVKDLALHLSYNCVRALSRLQDALVECKEEIHDLPVLPDIARPKTEQEPGFQKRPFRCEVCSRSYRHAGSLINHKQTHKTGIFRCPICQKRFFNLMAMKNHNRIHFELKRHKCLDCGKAFRLQKQLDTHQRIHRQRASAKKPGRRNRKSRHRRFAHKKSIMQVPSEASSIEKVIGTGEMRSASRLKSKMDPDSRPYQCHECGRSYRHAGSLFNHKKSHKTGQYHCSICDKTYRNLMALKNHQRTHYEAKRHPCSQCGKTFKWRRQLFRHQIVHVPQGSQSDSEIPSGTEAKAITDQQVENSTNGHEASNFNNEDVSNGANELESRSCEENSSDVSAKSGAKESSQSEEPHGCDVCGHIDRHGGSLCRHMSKRESGKYKCSVCPEEFLNPIAMSTHLLTHSPEKHRQGVNCEQTVQSSQDLIIHNTVHVEGNPFRCPTCNHGFSCERTLRHHQRTHEQLSSQSSSLVSSTQRPNNEKKTSPSDEKSPNRKDQGDRKYKCKQCTRSYLHASSLFNHQKTHSIGVYKCPNCLKEFFNLLAFKNHLRIHRYNCKECGKAFRNSSDLVAHSETHQEGSFTCSLCNKHFLCRSSLKNHQRIHDNQDGDILDPQAVSKFMVEVT